MDYIRISELKLRMQSEELEKAASAKFDDAGNI